MPSNASKSRSRGPAVVVEIGSDWLKILQLERSRGRDVISRLHLEPLSGRETAAAQLLAEARRKLKLAEQPVIACLPRQTVNVRMLDLPSTDPQEIADMVDLQAAKQTPYSAEEILFDYRVVAGARAGYTRVLLAIAQRSALRQRFYAFDEAGFEVERMAVSSEGLLGWCRQAAPAGAGEALAVLDLDASYADFAVVAGGDLVFTKSILLGASALRGEDGQRLEKFAREVRQAREMLQSENPALTVGRLLLTGAGPNVPGLADELGRQLSLPVEPAPTDRGVALQVSGLALTAEPYAGVSIAPLIGLGLIREDLALDLMPDTVRAKKELVQHARNWTAFGLLLWGTLLSVSLFATTAAFLKHQRLRRLREEFLGTEPAVRQMEQRREVIKLVQRRDDPRLQALGLLEKLHALTGDVALDAIDYDAEKNQLAIEGSARAIKDVSALVQKLEQATAFVDVREGKPTSVDPQGRFRFQVVCGLEAQP